MRAAPPDPLHGRDIVCVGFNDWDNEVWTNQHHLMSRLAAAGNRVLFIESLGLRRPDLGSGRDLRRIVRRLRRGLGPPRQRRRDRALAARAAAALERAGSSAQRVAAARIGAAGGPAHALRAPVLWGYVPQAEVLLDPLSPALVVYHCVDDIAAQEGIDAVSFDAAERRFAAPADLVIASSPALAERMRTLSSHVLYAPNVADTERFATALDRRPGRPPRWRRCRSRGSCSWGRSPPRSSTSGCSARSPLRGRTGRSPWSGRSAWATPTPTSRRSPRSPNVHLLGARPQARPARGAARRRGRPDPVPPFAPDREHLPDEGLRVSVRRVFRWSPPACPASNVSRAWTSSTVQRSVLRVIEQARDAPRTRQSAAERAATPCASHSWEARIDEIAAALAR